MVVVSREGGDGGGVTYLFCFSPVFSGVSYELVQCGEGCGIASTHKGRDYHGVHPVTPQHPHLHDICNHGNKGRA